MTSAFRQLRADLVISRQEFQGGKSGYVVKDPRTQRYFKFSEPQYALCEALREGRSFPEIQQMLSERFQASMTEEQLEQFLNGLEKNHLLESSIPPVEIAIRQQSVLWYRLPLTDPRAFLAKWTKRFWWVFTPVSMAIMGALMVVALGLSIVNSDVLAQTVTGLFSLESAVPALLAMFVLGMFHEYAHAMTCHHFGGEVREIGFYFIYFTPAFYANVTDALMFPKKIHRIWVMLAGSMMDLTLWALATIVWRLTDPQTVINQLCVLVMAVNGIHSLFNLFPLLKLDGYFILSIWTGIPNLRARAFSYVFQRLKSWGWTGEPAPTAFPSERVIYWGYGVLGLAYSWFFLALVLRNVYEWLMVQYQAQGFLLATGLLIFMFKAPLTRLKPVRWATQEGGIVRKILVLTALVGILTVGAFRPWALKVSSPCVIQVTQRAEVTAEVEGLIEEVMVKEGDRVEPGTEVVRLSAQRAHTELKEMEARSQGIEVKRVHARKDLRRNQELSAKNLVSRQALEASEREVEALEKEAAELAARMEGVRRRIDQAVLKSPITGTIVTPNLVQLKGTYLQIGKPFCEIQNVEQVIVEMAVPEKEIADVKVGLPVRLKTSSYPTRVFEGTVSSIAPVVSGNDLFRGVMVRAVIANPDAALKGGMTGYAKIYCGIRSGWELALRRVIRWFRVEFWALW